MPRPCICDRYIPGEPWVLGRDCRVCYLYHNDKRYKALWGPAQPPVGDALFLIAALFRIRETPGCPCKSMRLKMNRWGIKGCRENMPTILNHLQQESYKRDLPLVRWQLRAAVEVAIGVAWLARPLVTYFAKRLTTEPAKPAMARIEQSAENDKIQEG